MVWLTTRWKRVIEDIPLFGSLFFVSKKARHEAAFELVLTTTFSTLPIWFWGLVSGLDKYLQASEDRGGFSAFLDKVGDALYTGVQNGELLMLSVAIMGPALYLIYDNIERAAEERYPWIRLQLFIFVILTLVSTGLFLLIRYQDYTGESVLVYASLVIYVFALALLFPPMAHKKNGSMGAVQEAHEKGTAAYAEGYSRHRRG